MFRNQRKSCAMKAAPRPIGAGVSSADTRTVIVSWHWPPTQRASATVLGNLFRAAPLEAFHLVTRAFTGLPKPSDFSGRIPATCIRWPGDDQRPTSLRDWPACVRVVRQMVDAVSVLAQSQRAHRILAVYPHRLSLLAGWLAAKRTRLPLALYMHDLMAEALVFRDPVRRPFWRLVDRRALAAADLVIVPTQEFADHYHSRGVHQTWVLPHCAASHDALPLPPADSRVVLRIVYSGMIYEPHVEAIRAFAAATGGLKDVKIDYYSPPGGCDGLMGRLGARWVGLADARAAMHGADVLVVLLGSTQFRQEVQGCFPSKIIEYLSVGRPILAVVPAGSFVHRLVETTGIGVAVTDLHSDSIRRGIDELRCPERRRSMSAAAKRVLEQLDADIWMDRLVRRLRLPADESVQDYPFPDLNTMRGAEKRPSAPPIGVRNSSNAPGVRLFCDCDRTAVACLPVDCQVDCQLEDAGVGSDSQSKDLPPNDSTRVLTASAMPSSDITCVE